MAIFFGQQLLRLPSYVLVAVESWGQKFRGWPRVSNASGQTGSRKVLDVFEKKSMESMSRSKITTFPNVIAGVLASAEKSPEAIALSEITTSTSITYGALVATVGGFAQSFNDLGVFKGSVVAVYAPRSAEAIVAILGILAAGAAFLPLDTGMPEARIRNIIDDARPTLVLIGCDTAVPACFNKLPVYRIDSMTSTGALRIRQDSLAYLIYTSGSTGTPKGVAVHDTSLGNYLDWCNKTLSFSGGGTPIIGSLAYDHGVTALFPPLFHAETLEIYPERGTLRTLMERSPDATPYSYMKIAPSYLRILTPQERASVARMARTVVFGGEALHGELVDELRRDVPNLRVINHYGPTETTVGCCTYEVPAGNIDGAVPIGRPIGGTSAIVVGDDGAEVFDGSVGELYIGGASVTVGYWNSPELTNARFVERQNEKGEFGRWFRTGDLVHQRTDGNFVFRGRIDDQVKVLGYRVEPAEVEQALRSAAGVADACVFGIVRSWGTELVAVVAPHDNASMSKADLRRHVSLQLPSVMVPSRFFFCDKLPAKSSGKVDRKALLEIAGAGTDEGDDLAERVLFKWREVLHVEDLGLDDDFFEVGGDSVAAMELCFWSMDGFGIEIEPTAVFEYPTPRQFIEELLRICESAAPLKA